MSLSPKAISKLESLASMRSGDGVDDFLLSVADHVRHEVSGPEEAKSVIRPYLAQARRERSDFEIERELNRQVQTAYTGFTRGDEVLTNTFKPKPKWPEQNQTTIAKIAADGPGLYDLWESSPARWDDDKAHTEEIIDELFPGDPLLCVGRSNWEFWTAPRQVFRGDLSGMALIVPSPMSAVAGTTQEGKQSQHTLANTGPRRFLVVEFDFGPGTEDKQAAIIWHLAQYGKLALVLHSGSKSLHAWFFCAGSNEVDGSPMRGFMEYAVALGGDYRGWLRSQFMRMPDGTRDNGNRQAVIYFNPEVTR